MDRVSSRDAMVVVFGRPGAGKTTISNMVLDKLKKHDVPQRNNEALGKNNTTNKVLTPACLLLDLDVCVPIWMRENFAKGIYPTLEQRREFAIAACDYVDDEMKKFHKNNEHDKISIVISFSFVNTDLRDYFKTRFPSAKWALVDVNDAVAQDRINSREGHFYKGAPPSSDDKSGRSSKEDTSFDESSENHEMSTNITSKDNSEWDFAPVDYDHVILNGLDPVEMNAEIVIEMLLTFL